MPYIYGDRLYLRALEAEDWEYGYRWINNPKTTHYLPIHRPYSALKERAWYEKHAAGDSETEYQFGIVLTEDDHYIGNTSLFDVNWRNRQAEVGILIGEEDDRGKGYGSEALRLLLAFAFDHLGLHRVWLRVFAENDRAIKAYQRTGFKQEGVTRDDEFYDGAFHDTFVMSVLEHEFRS